jgi:hypothetical protein
MALVTAQKIEDDKALRRQFDSKMSEVPRIHNIAQLDL